MSVWVVDDNDGLCRLIARVAQDAGHTTRAFDNGVPVLEALEAGEAPPDLLLLDIMMPDMDGIEVIAGLPSHTITCPVVFMTGGHEVFAEAAMAMAREKGIKVHGLVKKPIPVAALKQIMATVH